MLNTMAMLFTILAMTSAVPATLADGKAVLAKHSISFLAARKVGVAKLMSANPAALEKECEECVGHEENEIGLLKDLVKVEEEVIDLEKRVTEKKGKQTELKNLVKDEQEKKAMACAKVKASGDKAAVVPDGGGGACLLPTGGVAFQAFYTKVGAKESDMAELTKAMWTQKDLNDEDMKVVACLLASGSLAKLQRLDLYGNNISDEGMKAFASAIASGALVNLNVLNLSDNRIGDAGMVAFAGSMGSLAKLEKLFLYNNQIGDAGMAAFAKAIAASGSLANLKTLNLAVNQIGDAGMTALAGEIASGSLPAVENVFLDGNPGGDGPVTKALAERKE